jgi:hypothetical protein
MITKRKVEYAEWFSNWKSKAAERKLVRVDACIEIP